MKLRISPIGTGACPICVRNANCRIQQAMDEMLGNFTEIEEMEIVIYTCPRFKEKP